MHTVSSYVACPKQLYDGGCINEHLSNLAGVKLSHFFSSTFPIITTGLCSAHCKKQYRYWVGAQQTRAAAANCVHSDVTRFSLSMLPNNQVASAQLADGATGSAAGAGPPVVAAGSHAVALLPRLFKCPVLLTAWRTADATAASDN